MGKYNVDDFYKLKRYEVMHLNQSDYSIYNNMVKDINFTPIREYNYVKGMFVDTLFVGVVRSMSKGMTESGTLTGRLTLEDNSGRLSVSLFEKDICEVYKLDLDVPIKIVLGLTNDNPPKAPAYRFISATDL